MSLPSLGDAGPVVAASFLPIAAHVAAVSGNRIDARTLCPAGGDPHDFAPTPTDYKTLSQADLLVVNGFGVEEWLTTAAGNLAGKKTRILDLSKAPGLLAAMTPGERDAAKEGNPHAWLDPVLAKEQAKAIRDALKELDPAHAADYDANTAAYLAKLDALDADFRALFASLPAPRKELFTLHDAFPWFASRYGLHYLGSVEDFPEKEPGPQKIAALITKLKAAHVGTVFAEEGYSPKLLKRIATESGAAVAELDTLEVAPAAVAASLPRSEDYLLRMRRNLETLREAWTMARP
ncbi:metal ABC transporter substrate-binding protein [Verrucomicrobium sp. GAS474]|uniref:metal ABC transporter substrate-binding protein n=1 Tax=Verrucomicrobium sp. GAS474 TaxID=1882831 RepID=UPI0012FFB533|nr:metal ABC transporter substrate-binding protein [Verrucomicrobium sp. GAS474]